MSWKSIRVALWCGECGITIKEHFRLESRGAVVVGVVVVVVLWCDGQCKSGKIKKKTFQSLHDKGQAEK